MKSSKFAASLIALASLAAGSAFAADDQALTFSEAGRPFPVTASTKTHEQVQAEYQAARAAGTLPVFGEVSAPVAEGASTRSRADVQAETSQAAKTGALPKFSEL